MRTIEIYKGYEYRTKDVKPYNKNGFFYDTYKRCIDVVLDICNENNKVITDNKEYSDQGYGRCANILLITGRRGSGKTSTLFSVAEVLKEDKEYSRELLGADTRTGFYIVKGIIDPSSMKKKESIIRIFLSRLYAEYVKTRDIRFRSGKQTGMNEHTILDLFEKCYQNLEALSDHNKSGGYDQDELDILASMGDSSGIVNNLGDLINELLIFFKGEDGPEYRYMVIKIDDMDLAAGNVYKLIDDIRNYLSLRNLIILMAVDFEQLEFAVSNEYLKRYKSMVKIKHYISNDSEDNEAAEIVKHCIIQAGRYVEKVFPEGHCVSVPKLDEEIRTGADELKFRYFDGKDEKHVKGNQDSITDQLLSLIYDKTGIVLTPDKALSQRFFPTTLRELTHLLRLLFDMKTERDDNEHSWYAHKAYLQAVTKSGDEALGCVRDNIKRLTEYLCNYWCSDRLDSVWSRKIREYLRENDITDIPEMENCDNDYSKKDRETIEAAISVAKALRFNQALLESWMNTNGRIGVSEKIISCYDQQTNSNDSSLICFDVDLETFEKDLSDYEYKQDDIELNKWLELLCSVRWKDNADKSQGIIEGIRSKNIKNMRFDVANFLPNLLKTSDLKHVEGIGISESHSDDDTNRDMSINGEETDNEKKEKAIDILSQEALCDVRDVVANYECYISYIISVNSVKKRGFKGYDKWSDVVKDIRTIVDNAVNTINGEKRGCLGEYMNLYLNMERWIYLLFRNNKEARQFLEKRYREMLIAISERINQIISMDPKDVFYINWHGESGKEVFFSVMQKDIQMEENRIIHPKAGKNNKDNNSTIDQSNAIIAKTNVEIRRFRLEVEKILGDKKTDQDVQKQRLEEIIEKKKKSWQKIISNIEEITERILEGEA